MKTKIEIECESGKELLEHLAVISKQIKDKIKEIKKAKSIIVKKPMKIQDGLDGDPIKTGYGNHTVTIKDFCVDDMIF